MPNPTAPKDACTKMVCAQYVDHFEYCARRTKFEPESRNDDEEDPRRYCAFGKGREKAGDTRVREGSEF